MSCKSVYQQPNCSALMDGPTDSKEDAECFMEFCTKAPKIVMI